MKQILTTIIYLVTLFALSGCGDPLKSQIEQQIPVTETRINQLADALERGDVRNANMLKQYVAHLKRTRPELSAVIDELGKDATTSGPMFKSIQDRLATAKSQPQMFASTQDQFDELVNLYQAADPVLFSDALSDPLNVLADMSQGELPRVNSLSQKESIAANRAQDFGVGQQLIGNPNYGQWQTDSNGMSFWAWYGMYSMMGDLFGSRRVYYNDWGRHRNYSYYHDYGRKRYTSPRQWQKQADLDNRTKKSFGNKGFTSAYSKNRTGASSLSQQSNKAQSSSNRFRSTNSTSKSSYAKNSSLRNSSTSTSRGFRRGK